MEPRPLLTITFHKSSGYRPLAWWSARRRTGGTMQGGHMPIGHGVIPHDLAHLATEASLGIEDGFWGLLARGATFRHGTDRRPTRTGRALISTNRAGLHAAEQLGNLHHGLWVHGHPTPVAATFDRLAEAWRGIPDGGTMTVTWPLATTRPVVATTPAQRASTTIVPAALSCQP
ncbi:MAG: hypothetical protein JWN62_4053 [Acidimicrobiales bacterium]|nr:hypothetical protein [Acidimicrobiales bacterium]